MADHKGWLGSLAYLLLGLLLAVGLNIALGIVLATEMPVVTISSASMYPTMGVGDIAVIRGSGEYELGDIIVFRGWEYKPIIHRIVAIVEDIDGKMNVERLSGFNEELDWEKLLKNGKVYITKGDNNARCDQCIGRPPVLEKSIYGEAVLTIPYLGWVKLLFLEVIKSPTALAAIILIVVAYFVIRRLF